MGSWGVGVEQDDYFLDVYGAIEQAMREGSSLAEACSRAVEANRAQIEDDDEGPVFWQAVAKAQWTYGQLQPDVLERVRGDVEAERGMERWVEAGEKTVRARKAALIRFLDKVSVPRPKPKAPPRKKGRKPLFSAGDCLSIRHPDGRFGAAIVTVADDSEPELGKNLVCTLNYLEPVPPPPEVFEARDWLRPPRPSRDGDPDCTWFFHIGFRAVRSSLEVVATTEIRASDPRDSNLFGNWKHVGAQALRQAEGDGQTG